MAALSTHLTVGVTIEADHSRLEFRDDCPFCHQERLAGPVSSRARAARPAPARSWA
jgi:hypothetical protein